MVGFFRASSASSHHGYGSVNDNCSSSNTEARSSWRNGMIISSLAGFIMLLVANFLSCANKGGGYILTTHSNHVGAKSRPRFGSDKYAVQGLEQFAWLKPVLPCCGEYHVLDIVLIVTARANDSRKIEHRISLRTLQPDVSFRSGSCFHISGPILRFLKPLLESRI